MNRTLTFLITNLDSCSDSNKLMRERSGYYRSKNFL